MTSASSKLAKKKRTDVRLTLQSTLDEVKRLVSIKEFGLDPCASKHQKIKTAEDMRKLGCREYMNSGVDGWNGLTSQWYTWVFVNPPYSDIESWVIAAQIQMRNRNIHGCVFIIPDNRSHQPWYQRLIESARDSGGIADPQTQQPGNAGYALRTINIAGRQKFGTPRDPYGKRKNNRPKFGLQILYWQKVA